MTDPSAAQLRPSDLIRALRSAACALDPHGFVALTEETARQRSEAVQDFADALEREMTDGVIVALRDGEVLGAMREVKVIQTTPGAWVYPTKDDPLYRLPARQPSTEGEK